MLTRSKNQIILLNYGSLLDGNNGRLEDWNIGLFEKKNIDILLTKLMNI